MNNNSKTAVALLAVGLVVAAVSSLTPSQVSAQEAKLMYACYMQGSGVVYRINPPDDPGQDPKLKDDCTGKKHVKFYWVEFVGSDGKVGIGVPEPEAELDVAGDIHASGQLRLGDHTITIDPVTNTITSGPDEDIYILPGLPGTAGKVGIGTVEPDERLTVAGTIESTDGGFKFPDGSVQTSAITGGSGGSLEHGSLLGLDEDDHDQYLLVDGVRNATNGFAVTGTLGTGSIPVEGPGVRLMWYPAKAAFRVGHTRGRNAWRDDLIGEASVAMGVGSNASGYAATGLGSSSAIGDYSTALGDATAVGDYSSAMGSMAEAVGEASTAIGDHNIASGDYATAMGRYAYPDHRGSFVYGDASSTNAVRSPADNSFTVRASGGYNLYSNSALTQGVTLAPNGGAWSSVSDRNLKENFRVEDGEQALAAIASMPIQTWNYKAQDPSIRHMGPVAQDFYAAFGLGTDDKHINTVDIDGVNMLAVQALERRTSDLRAENELLRARIADLEAAVLRLEAAVSGREN